MGHIIDNAALRGVSLCFLSVRFKTVTRSVAFLENHTCWHRGTPRCPKILEIAAIVENYTCCLPELILQRRKSCSLRVILMHSSSMLGQIFLFFNVTPWRQKAALLTSPEILKIHICFTATEWVPLGTHSVAVKPCKRERRFRFLGHIPHILVDDGALFAFSLFRSKKNNQRSLRPRSNTSHSTFQPITIFLNAFYSR